MRRSLNAVGRFLLTGGTLLLVFVAYQLWGTGIYEAQQQSRLRSSFDAALVQVKQAQSPVSGTTTTTAPIPPPPGGEPIGIIRIPRIGLNRAIVQGIAVADLRQGPGHYPDSPMPGQVGNAAIAGHRTTYGQPFNQIDELVPGDEITIVTLNGSFKYLVTGHLIVSPRAVQVLDPTPDATLTLTTCHPKYSADQRLVVKAKLDIPHSPTPARPTPRTQRHVAVDGLTGIRESRTPVIGTGLITALVGGLWWYAFHRRKRWYVWVAGGLPFLVAYVAFCYYVERVLPPGF